MVERLISVIIPIYNAENYLIKCLTSILGQTYRNIELLLIDDGSVDNSGCISEEFALLDNRVIIIHGINSGQAIARNTGIECASGEFITFVDDDDWIEPNMYEELLLNALENHADISGCATVRDYEDGKSLYPFAKEISRIVSGEEISINILRQNKLSWGTVWNKLFIKELFNDIRFPRRSELEDYYVILKLLSNPIIIYFDKRPMYHWNQRNSSQSKRGFHPNMFTEIDVATKICEYYQNINSSESVTKASSHFLFIIYSSVFWRVYRSNEKDWNKKLEQYVKNARKSLFSSLTECKTPDDIKRFLKLGVVLMKCHLT